MTRNTAYPSLTTSTSPFRRNANVPGILCWILFALGLALQAFSPRMRIEHNAFVLPQGKGVDPRSLVVKQREVETWSAILVLVGAAGLALSYRKALVAVFRDR